MASVFSHHLHRDNARSSTLTTDLDDSVMLFKAKAKAEQKKLQAQGMKMGEDFVGCKFLSGPFQEYPARRA